MKAKQTRKISKKDADDCPRCHAPLKAGDRECPGCQQQAPLFEGKGVRLRIVAKDGTLGKAVAWGCPCRRLNPASAAKCAGCKSPVGSGWDCRCGRVNYGKAAFCSDCGCKRGAAVVRKSAAGVLTKRAHRDSVARGNGLRDAEYASVHENDPGMRVWYGEAIIDPDGAA